MISTEDAPGPLRTGRLVWGILLSSAMLALGGCNDSSPAATTVEPRDRTMAAQGGPVHPIEQLPKSPRELNRVEELSASVLAAKKATSVAVDRYTTAASQAERTPKLTARLWEPGALDKLTYRRSECYGTCPVYEIEIFGDGRVVWDGKRHVRTKGRSTVHLSNTRLQKLRDAFIEHDLLALEQQDLEEACQSRVTCQYTANITVELDGTTKKLEHYHGCYLPEDIAARKDSKYDCHWGGIFCRLNEVERAIERVAGVSRWE